MRKKVLYRKILVVKPSSLGDVVHSLPFLNAIRTCFPRAEIHWVIAKGFEGLLEGHPMINRLIVINKDLWKRLSKAGAALKDIRELYRQLRQEDYDLVIDLQGLLRSGLISVATRAPVRIGFQEAREGSRFFYTHKVRGGNLHAVDRYLKVAAELGCDTSDMAFPFPLSGSCTLARSMEEKGPYAVLVPGARWKTKIWPAGYFGKVASMLPVRSVVVGSRGDIPLAREIVSISGGKAVSLAGETDLKELIGIMRHASIVITNDSGPMHIAAALRVPVVAVFGPTSPERTGPYGKGHVVMQSSAACVPCFRKSCPDLKCMKEVLPQAVVEAAADLLCRKKTAAPARNQE